MHASHPDPLPEIEQQIWAELVAAAVDKSHPWRVATLATTDGIAGDARSVILRDVDVVDRTLLFFTDSRSPKVAQIAAHPQGTVLMWSPLRAWQLRLRVRLSVVDSGLAVSSNWARLKMSPSALDYLSPLPPGTALATHGSASSPPTPVPERNSRGHFGVVTAAVDALDWLALRADGHRRAYFDGAGARWLAP